MYASLYHKDCTLLEFEEQLTIWPNAANHDGTHYLFADTHPDTVNPLIVSTLTDSEGEPLTGDGLAWALAQLLADENNIDLVIWMTRDEATQLHKHPAWRIWCANYSDDQPDLFESDWDYITAMIAAAAPELSGTWPAFFEELTPVQGRDIILAAIQMNTGQV